MLTSRSVTQFRCQATLSTLGTRPRTIRKPSTQTAVTMPKAVKELKAKVEKPKKDVKPKKEKAKKDPNAPKRGLGAYMFFCKDKRDEIKSTVNSTSMGDIAKALGAAWQELDDAAKKPYQDQAEKDKVRYEKELAAYKNKGPAAKVVDVESESDSETDE